MEKRKNLPARLGACLLALLLLAPAASADEVYPKTLTTQEYQTLNLFLSNFTEVGVGEISPFSPDQVLVDSRTTTCGATATMILNSANISTATTAAWRIRTSRA